MALAKMAAASPDELKQRIDEAGLWPVDSQWRESNAPLLATVREAMRAEKTLHIDYADASGIATARAIWPAALAYYEEKQIIAARSEEHTSELQSLMRISYAVFCLKKKTIKQKQHNREYT